MSCRRSQYVEPARLVARPRPPVRRDRSASAAGRLAARTGRSRTARPAPARALGSGSRVRNPNMMFMPVDCSTCSPSASAGGVLARAATTRCLPPAPGPGPSRPCTPISRCQKSDTPPAVGPGRQLDHQRPGLAQVDEVQDVRRRGVGGDQPEPVPVGHVVDEVGVGGPEHVAVLLLPLGVGHQRQRPQVRLAGHLVVELIEHQADVAARGSSPSNSTLLKRPIT